MSGKDLLVNKAVLYASLLNGKGFEINGQDYAFEYDVTAEATEITLTTQQGSVPATTAEEKARRIPEMLHWVAAMSDITAHTRVRQLQMLS